MCDIFGCLVFFSARICDPKGREKKGAVSRTVPKSKFTLAGTRLSVMPATWRSDK